MTARMGLTGHAPGVTVRSAAETIEAQQEKLTELRQENRELRTELFALIRNVRSIADSLDDKRAAQLLHEASQSYGRTTLMRRGMEP